MQRLAGLPAAVRAGLARVNRAEEWKEWKRAALADQASPAARLVAYFRAHAEADAAARAAGGRLPERPAPPPAPARALPWQSENISPGMDFGAAGGRPAARYAYAIDPAADLAAAAEAARPARRTPNSSTYRRKRAYEVAENVRHALWMHGRAIARAAGRPEPGRDEAVRIGARHAVEFTVTMPGAGAGDARAFGRAWDRFNRKWLLLQPWAAGWVQVKECHKSGRIHAHHLLLVTADTWKSDKGLKWYQAGGKLTVAGNTCARWIADLWPQFRDPAGPLARHGLGTHHTFQPIREAGEFSTYIAKYLVKGFREDRPAHLKSVRLVNYAHNFPRAARVYSYRPHALADRPGWHRRRVHYMTREKRDPATLALLREARPARRWDMIGAFSFNGPAAVYRRAQLARIAPALGAENYDALTRVFGRRWAWFLEPLCALADSPGADWAALADGALAYKLAGMARYTEIMPLLIDGRGRRLEWARWQELDDDRKEAFTVAWEFLDKGTGEIIGLDRARERAGWYYREFLAAADARARAGAADPETRAFAEEFAALD